MSFPAPDSGMAIAVSALATLPVEAPGVLLLGEFHRWQDLSTSKAWFSKFHFGRRDCFELPFVPDLYVYSPVVQLRLTSQSEPWAYYRRGIAKYERVLRRGGEIPPVTLVYRPPSAGDATSTGHWCLEDGSHRTAAAWRAGRPSIAAVLAFPKIMLPKTPELACNPTAIAEVIMS